MRVRGFGYGPLFPETPACASEFLTAAGILHWVLVRPTDMVLRVIHDCQPSPEGSGAVWEHGFQLAQSRNRADHVGAFTGILEELVSWVGPVPVCFWFVRGTCSFDAHELKP